jgi:hypothetical protein
VWTVAIASCDMSVSIDCYSKQKSSATGVL